MKIFDRFKSFWREEKASLTGAYEVNGYDNIVNPSRDIRVMKREAYEINEVFFACVRAIVNQAKTIPFKVVNSNDKEVNLNDLDALLTQPNPIQSYKEFLTQVLSEFLISGNAYIEAEYPGDNLLYNQGKPSMLFCVESENINPIKGARNIPKGYKYKNGNEERVYQVTPLGKSNILHMKTYNPTNKWIGMSPIMPCAWSIDRHNAGSEWNYKMLKNGGKLSGILMPKGGKSLTREQFNHFRERMEDFQGASNAGKLLVTGEELSYQETGMNVKDMDFLNGMDKSAIGVCITMGVPPDLLFGQSTYENLETSNLHLAENTTIPLLDHFLSEMSGWLLERYGKNLRFKIEEDKIPALMPKRDKKRQSLETSSFLTINEKREEMGRDPVDGGDAVLVDMGKVPLAYASTQSAGSAAASKQSYIDGLVKQGYTKELAEKAAGIVFHDTIEE